MSGPLEDKFLRLRDENTDLKKTCNDQKEAIKRLTTKIAIYEENLRRSGIDDKGARYIEAQVTIAHQQEEIAGLRRRARKLQEAKRALEEIARGRRPRAAAAASGRPVTASGGLPRKPWEQTKGWTGHAPEFARTVQPAAPPAAPARAAASSDGRAAAAASLVAELRSRLDSLQRSLADRDARIETLQQQLAEARAAAGGDAAPIAAPSAAVDRALRDKEAKIILLQSKFDQLEAQSAARASQYDKALEALELMGRQLTEARAAAQAAEAELEMARARAGAADDADADLRAARAEIRRLEAQLEDTLSAPFFADGEGAAGMRERLRALEQSERQLRARAAHLEGTVQAQHSELEALRAGRERAAAELDEARDELAQLRVRADAAARGTEALRRHLALYTGADGDGDGVPLRELEEALAVVRAKGGAAAAGVLALPDTDPDDVGPEALRRRLREARAALLTAQASAERSDRLLRTQREFTKDLEAEVADLTRRLEGGGDAAAGRVRRYEEACRRKEETIRALRAKVLALTEAAGRRPDAGSGSGSGSGGGEGGGDGALFGARRGGSGGGHDDGDDDDTASVGSASTTASLVAAPGGLAPAETIIEVYVVSAELFADADPSISGMSSLTSLFAVVDFWDFESQASPAAAPPRPAFNFASRFRVAYDEALAWHAAEPGAAVSVDVFAARDADARLVGRATLPLHRLLASERGAVAFKRAPLLGRGGARVGLLRAESWASRPG
ncbi:hypothetical protein FNF28_07026 [Cafeteria roenbergensis]|uniref:RPGR-interacting protein 1 first C2 domain-containing protein n=1 Tax=Cafeteria roenbergensis TaxID=33653 RepID=A0A5A8CHH8_CAFRO|nr:hypothetical protein FNF28_07026 [Cafeteria roenbergensis]